MSEVVKYLQSYDDHFWHYENAGKVIAIPDGKTIGYSEFIMSEIIDQLAPQGLPRFGSLLLAMVATNPQGLKTIENILTNLSVYPASGSDLEEGINFAKLLTEIPIEYKKGKLRLELLRAIFHNSHNSISKAKSKVIQRELREHDDISHYRDILIKKPLPETLLYYDFKPLGLIGKELTSVEAILARVANLLNVKEVFEEIDFQEHTEISEEGLIEQLVKEQKTAHVGSLVSRIMSGLNIPFHSSLPSQQPLGGVADITNKGSFDKLLISEFAFDDVILMSRLANSESLYKHREVPPSDNNYNRVILIDVTLKNWGAIRTIAFASMLAITNHPKNKNPCQVFLVGKSYQEIAFETTSDIIKAMLVMDSSLDPGVGLTKLFTEEAIEVSEIFFIGNQEGLNQPVMQRFSAEYGKRIDHWIHPTSEGAISVYKNPKRGKRFIQEFKLPIAEVWKDIKPTRQESTTDFSYPILFPNGSKLRSLWVGREYSYVSTKYKSLFRFYGSKGPNNHTGLEMIDSNFSNDHNILAVMTLEDLSTVVLVAEPRNFFALIWPNTGKRVPINSYFKLNKSWKYYTEKDYFTVDSSYKIHLDGSVTASEGMFQIKKKNPPISYPKPIYVNLNRVIISPIGRLCFGKHELFHKNGTLMLRLLASPPAPIKIAADALVAGVFQFPDGSKIHHNKNGMLTLVSSNRELPNVYFPCVLGNALGAATTATFTGDPYYRMDQRNELFFDDENFMRADAITLIQTILVVRLESASQIVEKRVATSDDHSKLQYLQEKLGEKGINTTLKQRGLSQTLLPPDQFYLKYIQPFIDQIIAHGNSTD